jgi:hypothetical protein
MPEPTGNEIDLAIDGSLGGAGVALHALFAKHRPMTFEALITIFCEHESCDQMKRWSGMKEHPIAVRYRLKFGSKWDEARVVWWAARNDAAEVRQGKKRNADPELAAWKKLIEVFPPKKRPGVAIPDHKTIEEFYTKYEASKPKIPPEVLARLKELKGDSDPTADAIFVYEHFSDPKGVELAPTRGALMLLVECRDNPPFFWNTLWPKVSAEIAKRRGGSGPKVMSPKERRDIDEVKAILRQAVVASKGVA